MKTKSSGHILKLISLIILIFAVLVLLAVVSLYFYARSKIDFDADEAMFDTSIHWNSTTFYADENKYDDEYIPIKIESAGSLKKEFYSLDEISNYIKDGFISVEDRIFYTHHGVDIKRTMYAAVNLIFKHKNTFGASTITQQVIKNISGDNEITLTRKLSEIIRALSIEQKYSKDEIFEVYLNIIPMGDNIYGVGLASRSYFGKEPSELTPAEAATLIGITNAPTAYNPYSNPDMCRTKRNNVLAIMRDTGVISEEEYSSSISEPLNVMPRELREDKYDSWFTETVIADITQDFAKENGISERAASIRLLGGGYSVYTTMDIRAQKILENFFENKDNFPNEVNEGLEFSMVITDTRTGDISAIVGRVGEKRANRILNHATLPHTPASALKPLALYAPLIEEGKICWSSVFDDIPVSFSEQDGEWVAYPRNSPAVYDGLTTISEAVKKSKNTVAVRLYNMRGGDRIYNDLIERYAISTLVKSRRTDGGTVTDIAASPLALGQLCDGISLRKLVECYGAFASDGVLSNARSYVSVKDSSGNVVLTNNNEQKRIYKESTARIMNQLLSQVVTDGTARSITLKSYIDVAGKTGTSGGSLDKIFIGYTPYYVCGVWCGYENDRRAVNTTSHLSAWDSVMTALHEDMIGRDDVKHFSTDGLLYRAYCMDSGELYSDNCILDPRGSRLAYGYFTQDTAPATLCTRHIVCPYDTVTKGISLGYCPSDDIALVSLLDIPDRKFPMEIYILDAEFVYRGIKSTAEVDYTSDLPYFYALLPEGEYAGISDRKRQFNAPCHEH